MQTALRNTDGSSSAGTGAAALVLPGTAPVRRRAEHSALGRVSRGSSSLKSPSTSKEQLEERLTGQPSTSWRAEGKGRTRVVPRTRKPSSSRCPRYFLRH